MKGCFYSIKIDLLSALICVSPKDGLDSGTELIYNCLKDLSLRVERLLIKHNSLRTKTV